MELAIDFQRINFVSRESLNMTLGKRLSFLNFVLICHMGITGPPTSCPLMVTAKNAGDLGLVELFPIANMYIQIPESLRKMFKLK